MSSTTAGPATSWCTTEAKVGTGGPSVLPPFSSSATTATLQTTSTAHLHQQPAANRNSESHRVYWQQWIANSGGSNTNSNSNSNSHTAGNSNSNSNSRADPTTSSTTACATTTTTTSASLSRRELITSSAAVRISPAAKASDLTALLRQTLHLPPLVNWKTMGHQNQQQEQLQEQEQLQDSLVLVGTLYSLPRDYVQFEHELLLRRRMMIPMVIDATSNSVSTATATAAADKESTAFYVNSASNNDPFHVVQTIPPDASPLEARQHMEQYLNRFLERAHTQHQQQQQQTALGNSGSTSNNNNNNRAVMARTIISPKLQLYYVPAPSVMNTVPAADGDANNIRANTNGNGNTNSKAVILNCVELDGYCTDMEEENDFENDESFVDEGDEEEDDLDDDALNIQSLASFERDTLIRSRNDDIGSDPVVLDPLLLSPEQMDVQWLVSQFSWLSPSSSPFIKASASTRWQQRMLKEDLLFAELQQQLQQQQATTTTSNTTGTTLSGYLLKRDAKDCNVWRRVYCVLTHDYLWYVSRVYTHDNNDDDRDPNISTHSQSSTFATKMTCERWARHGRIRLTRALLLEPTTTTTCNKNDTINTNSPLVRIPYAWEMVSGRGISHVFRASSQAQEQQWIRALQEGTIQSFEKSLLASAELLIRDGCLARNQRFERVAVEPLWNQIAPACEDDDDDTDNNTSLDAEHSETAIATSSKIFTGGAHMQTVLRFGLQVAEYRECCRYIQSILPNAGSLRLMRIPSSTPAVSPAVPAPSRFGSSFLQRSASGSSSPCVTRAMDMTAHDTIHAAWDQAAALLVCAKHLGLTLQRHSFINSKTLSNASLEQQVSVEVVAVLEPNASVWQEREDGVPKLSHSVDTLCQHIDFVITGRFRRNQPSPAIVDGNRVRTVSNDADHEFQPPPTDLFDRLLNELQTEAVGTDRKQQERWRLL